jgi:hypothetical protein
MDQRALQVHLRLLGNRLEADCQAAEMRIRGATSMSEVVRNTHVSVPPELRGVRNGYPGYRRMTSAAERRLEALLQEHLTTLKTGSLEEAEARFARYQHHEWQALRGTYASLYRRGEMEGRRLLHAQRQAGTST